MSSRDPTRFANIAVSRCVTGRSGCSSSACSVSPNPMGATAQDHHEQKTGPVQFAHDPPQAGEVQHRGFVDGDRAFLVQEERA